jgi:hypothetical protein
MLSLLPMNLGSVMSVHPQTVLNVEERAATYPHAVDSVSSGYDENTPYLQWE